LLQTEPVLCRSSLCHNLSDKADLFKRQCAPGVWSTWVCTRLLGSLGTVSADNTKERLYLQSWFYLGASCSLENRRSLFSLLHNQPSELSAQGCVRAVLERVALLARSTSLGSRRFTFRANANVPSRIADPTVSSAGSPSGLGYDDDSFVSRPDESFSFETEQVTPRWLMLLKVSFYLGSFWFLLHIVSLFY